VQKPEASPRKTYGATNTGFNLNMDNEALDAEFEKF
jgi:hypothetical protein